MVKRWILLALFAGAAWALYSRLGNDSVYKFKGISGPVLATPSLRNADARLEDFRGGSRHRLAVLVTDRNSGWLGLARGLKAHGIPFIMTTDVSEALKHKVVYVYPIVSGVVLHGPDFDALRAHVAKGGSLLTFDLEGGGLNDLFGVAGAPAGAHSDAMHWLGTDVPDGEKDIRVSKRGTEAQVGVVAYSPNTGRTLATFESGGAALTCRKSSGNACALGVDIGALTARAMNGREEGVGRSYVNGFEPSVDALYQWIASFYVDGEPMPWLIDTAPAGKDVSILLTHDVDFTSAVKSAATSADSFATAGVHATFFMQTKYVRDFNDDVFFNAAALPLLSSILQRGMEIGSHSVSHARTMKRFPMGSGTESYPQYRPFVQNRDTTRDATILGELRVSRYLLEQLVKADVTSFRAGYLSNPFGLPQALAASGYRYDSSITANSCLTHLPFELTEDRADRSLEPVYEFPVTIEDEAKPELIDRFDSANTVIAQIAAMHGLVVILVHPDTTTHRLVFEQRIIATWAKRAWLASLREFGDWWRARDQADIDVVDHDGGWTMSVHSRYALDNLVIRLPKMTSTVFRLPAGMKGGRRQIVIDSKAGDVSGTF
jgi:peptidoglycan/xylan/chitin deacetylase (PgdA/CDA1 family)